MAQTVILGPFQWQTIQPGGLAPGDTHTWSMAILTGIPGPVQPTQQPLRALTVTAVPGRDALVQALSVTELVVVSEPSGQLTVNFIVINAHPTSNCFHYQWSAVMVLP
jgi:hypothetical protein